MTKAPTLRPELLPGPLLVLAEAGFMREAMLLAKEWGGRTFDIPAAGRLRAGSPLVKLLGREAARIVALRYGPGRLYVPLAAGRGAKKRDILSHPGGTAAAARDLHTSEQWVRRVRNQLAGESDARDREAGQLPLFDGGSKGR